MRVAVIMGGMSAEREVSLRTGRKVLDALDPARFEALVVDPRPRAESTAWLETLARERVDVAFVALHGRYGEDGTIQGLLELLGIPYTGSGVLASALAIDKVRSKLVYRDAGIPTPEFITLRAAPAPPTPPNPGGPPETLPLGSGGVCGAVSDSPPGFGGVGGAAVAEFPLPAVVKPSREGSTIGITIVREREQMAPAVALAFRHDDEVLVERFVAGVEITAATLGNECPRPLPLVEIVPKSGFYDYEMKYTPGATEEIVPARISAADTARAQELAVAAHQALGCRGMARTDMIVADDGVWVLETNTIPGMTETSLLPRAAAGAGIEFPRLVEMLIEYALEGRG